MISIKIIFEPLVVHISEIFTALDIMVSCTIIFQFIIYEVHKSDFNLACLLLDFHLSNLAAVFNYLLIYY